MHGYYDLDGNNETYACARGVWLKSFGLGDPRYRVGETELDGVRISTVFMGLDHSHDPDGPPILFETMVFGGKHDEDQWRCSTWVEAEAQHAVVIAMCSKALTREGDA